MHIFILQRLSGNQATALKTNKSGFAADICLNLKGPCPVTKSHIVRSGASQGFGSEYQSPGFLCSC